MSTELERRVKSVESKIAAATPCAHPLPMLENPTEAEIDALAEMLAVARAAERRNSTCPA